MPKATAEDVERIVTLTKPLTLGNLRQLLRLAAMDLEKCKKLAIEDRWEEIDGTYADQVSKALVHALREEENWDLCSIGLVELGAVSARHLTGSIQDPGRRGISAEILRKIGSEEAGPSVNFVLERKQYFFETEEERKAVPLLEEIAKEFREKPLLAEIFFDLKNPSLALSPVSCSLEEFAAKFVAYTFGRNARHGSEIKEDGSFRVDFVLEEVTPESFASLAFSVPTKPSSSRETVLSANDIVALELSAPLAQEEFFSFLRQAIAEQRRYFDNKGRFAVMKKDPFSTLDELELFVRRMGCPTGFKPFRIGLNSLDGGMGGVEFFDSFLSSTFGFRPHALIAHSRQPKADCIAVEIWGLKFRLVLANSGEKKELVIWPTQAIEEVDEEKLASISSRLKMQKKSIEENGGLAQLYSEKNEISDLRKPVGLQRPNLVGAGCYSKKLAKK